MTPPRNAVEQYQQKKVPWIEQGKQEERQKIKEAIEKLDKYGLLGDVQCEKCGNVIGCNDPDCCGGASYDIEIDKDGEFLKIKEVLAILSEEEGK
jgi:uncharacterized OB-fold protein